MPRPPHDAQATDPQSTGFWAELRRRRVLRVVGTYGVVAGSLMQAGAVILPAFDLPDSAMRLLILSLAAGLPMAVLLAWLLDISPRGIRFARRRLGGATSKSSSTEALEARADEPGIEAGGGASSDPGSEVGSEEEGAVADGSILARSLEMLLLGLALPVLAFASILLVVSWRTEGEKLIAGGGQTPTAEVASLAVLPLADLSQDAADGGFFARGMHEDILAQLARIDDLKLISRTSVMSYERTTKSLREIGEELGVDHVLEGSVRRAGGAVRVTAQLIRVADDAHVWASQFDAQEKDVFAVQSQIAGAIAQALERELAPPDDPAAEVPRSVVPAAYDAYQKARDLHRDLDTADRATLDGAQRLYEEARRYDPEFAPAWLELAILHAQALWFGLDGDPARARQARRCLDEARRLSASPDRLALAEGIFAYYVDEDFGKALLYFEDARRLAPADPEALFYRAMILRRRGELPSAVAAIRQSLELDPLNLGHRDELALTLAQAGALAEARTEALRILRDDPKRPRTRLLLWQLELELDGDPERLLTKLFAADRSQWLEPHYTMLETVAILAGDPTSALAVLERPTPTPLAAARLALQRAVLEAAAGRAADAAARTAEARRLFAQGRPAGASDESSGGSPAERQLEALIRAEEGRLDEAIALQTQIAEAHPVERDLIAGGPPLWLLAELQARAGRGDEAADSLERLAARQALGSVPFGGHFVLHHAPSYHAVRGQPRFAALLARLRPDYADRWPPARNEPEPPATDPNPIRGSKP